LQQLVEAFRNLNNEFNDTLPRSISWTAHDIQASNNASTFALSDVKNEGRDSAAMNRKDVIRKDKKHEAEKDVARETERMENLYGVMRGFLKVVGSDVCERGEKGYEAKMLESFIVL